MGGLRGERRAGATAVGGCHDTGGDACFQSIADREENSTVSRLFVKESMRVASGESFWFNSMYCKRCNHDTAFLAIPTHLGKIASKVNEGRL